MNNKSLLSFSAFGVFCFLITCFSSIAFAQYGGEDLYGVNMDRRSMWPRNAAGTTVIDVCWENPAGYEEEIGWVRAAVEQTWGNSANIQFNGWGKCTPGSRGIRIIVKDVRPHCKGLGSRLDGMFAGMALNFTFRNFPCHYSPENCIKFVAVHEFGHALGIAHEQDRRDCDCDEEPHQGGGGWYVTPCDPNSVMNYCNPRWNNYGKLSKYDIAGIQTIYGTKPSKRNQHPKPQPQPEKEEKENIIAIVDELGKNQLHENVYLQIGGTGQSFFVNTKYKTDKKLMRIAKSGWYEYKLYSKTIYADKRKYYGYGSGRVYLDKNKNYSFPIVAGWDEANKGFRLRLGSLN